MRKLSAQLERIPKILLPNLGPEITKKLYVELRMLLMNNGYEHIEPILHYDYIELKERKVQKIKDITTSIEEGVNLEKEIDLDKAIQIKEKTSVEAFVASRVPSLVRTIMSLL